MNRGSIANTTVNYTNSAIASNKGSPNSDSTMESKPPIYCILLMWQYIYGRERERNQDSKSYLDSKSSCKSRMNVR